MGQPEFKRPPMIIRLNKMLVSLQFRLFEASLVPGSGLEGYIL